MPPAPARFSTTNCWPKASLSRWATMRVMVSGSPPAAYGTTILTGLAGYACAALVAVSCAAAPSQQAISVSMGQYRSRVCIMRTSARPALSNLESFHRFRDEQLFGRKAALGQPLLVVIAQKSVEHVAVGRVAVRPPVLAHFPAQTFDFRDNPRQ